MKNLLLFFLLFISAGVAIYAQRYLSDPDQIVLNTEPELQSKEPKGERRSYSVSGFLTEAVFGKRAPVPDNRSAERRALERSNKLSAQLIGFNIFWIPFFFTLVFLDFRKREKFYEKMTDSMKSHLGHRLHHASMDIVEKNDLIRRLEKSGNGQSQRLAIEIIRTSMLKNGDWDEFANAFRNVFPEYVNYMNKNFPGLNESDKRILMLAKWRLDCNLISQFMMVSQVSIELAWKQIKLTYNLNEDLSIEDIADIIGDGPLIEEFPTVRRKAIFA